MAPDLSGRHDAFAVTKLPPCVSSNQRNLHWAGLTSYFHTIHHCWHHIFMSLGTLGNHNCLSLNQCYRECSKFCVCFFSPWLTVNLFGHVTHFWYSFICRGIFQIYAECYSTCTRLCCFVKRFQPGEPLARLQELCPNKQEKEETLVHNMGLQKGFLSQLKSHAPQPVDAATLTQTTCSTTFKMGFKIRTPWSRRGKLSEA